MLNLVQETVQHSDIIWCLDFDKTGEFFVTGSSDYSVNLYSINDNKYKFI